MPNNAPDLSISAEKICFIIAKAREFDAKDVVTDPNDASNPSDDAIIAVLEDHRDDPVMQELLAVIGAMSEDEQVDLVTLAWRSHRPVWHFMRRGTLSRPQVDRLRH